MNNDTQSKFTPEEHELFNKIAIDIKNNVDSYCQAGQWLDKFYDEVGKNRTPSIIIKFGKARKNLTEKYKEENFLTEEDAKKVIIITWLLTDPDAENNKLNITKFEEWKWEPLNDVTKLSRGFAGFLFAQNKDTLMRLVRIGWDKITTSRQIASKDKKKSEKFWQTNTFKFVIIPLVVALFLGIPAWFSLGNKTTRDSNGNMEETVGKLEEQVKKAKEIALPPTLSLVQQKVEITKTDSGYTALLVFKPSKNKHLGQIALIAKVIGESSGKIVDFWPRAGPAFLTGEDSKKISADGKKAWLIFQLIGVGNPQVELKMSEASRVQISSSHIPEPFFVDIE